MLQRLIEKYWLPLTLALIAVITFLSLKPNGISTPVAGFDKIYHCLAYAGLAFPIAVARPKHWQWFVLGFVIYSGVIELIQPFTGRQREFLDLIMNAVGLMIGTLVGRLKIFQIGRVGKTGKLEKPLAQESN